MIGMAVAAVATGVIIAVWPSPPAPASSTVSTVDSPDATDLVTYTVTGAATDMITYANGSGNIAQVTDLTGLPWTAHFSVPAGTEGFLSVSAQNAGYGQIGCSISINGQVVARNTSTGQYAVVECSR